MEEPTRLELVNSRFAIYGLTNLAMAPVLLFSTKNPKNNKSF